MYMCTQFYKPLKRGLLKGLKNFTIQKKNKHAKRSSLVIEELQMKQISPSVIANFLKKL